MSYPRTRMILEALVNALDNGGVRSTRELAFHVAAPQASIRRLMAQLLRQGLVVRTAQGWKASPSW